ncbi:MAG: hypothetical protein A2144_13820 [Chloroflexi bacterium RBG_16_50_9]|nr:MAG: hypothetical protein A2144_13820 [Chloroflexi bacterium RBG_16_50_9]
MQQMEIRIKGQIDRNWADWFGGLTITHTENGETVLTGPVRDQAALHGLLSRLADLGLPLVSVTSTGMSIEKPTGDHTTRKA